MTSSSAAFQVRRVVEGAMKGDRQRRGQLHQPARALHIHAAILAEHAQHKAIGAQRLRLAISASITANSESV